MNAEVKNRELSSAWAHDWEIPSPTSARGPGILIADEMALVLMLLKYELEPRGFSVWLAVDGDDAIDLYRRNRAEIDLVVLDEQLPGLDGPHTLAALRRLDPEVLACFLTRKSGAYTDQDLLDCGALRIFHKPIREEEVAQNLQDLLESAGSAA